MAVPAFIDDIPGNRHAFDRLRALLAGGKAIGFVGAGASAGLYPLWGRLLDELVGESERRGLSRDEDRAVWRKLAGTKAQRAASLIYSNLGPDIFAETIRRLFGPKDPPWTPTHEAILSLPFRGLVTTNYDPCLVEARRKLRPDAAGTGVTLWNEDAKLRSWLEGDIHGNQSPILHAHGLFDQPDSIVLTQEQYREAYAPGPYRRAFEKLWAQDKLVFVGFGFSDPFLDFLIDQNLAEVGGPPRHLALIGFDDASPPGPEDRRAFIASYGLEAVFYPVRDHDHGALLKVLEALAGSVPVERATLPAGSRQVLYNLPDLPPRYQERSDALARLRDALLAGNGAAHHAIVSRGRIAGVLGMGGIGKTVLATGIVHDPQIRDAFPDGIFWLSFGRNVDVTARQAELARALGSQGEVFKDWQEGRARLGQLTAEGRRLIVLDDVWEPQAAEAFTRQGPGCRLVVTTRDARVLEKAGAVRHQLDELQPEAALALLAEAADEAIGDLPAEATTIARECGHLPLALQSAGALIRTGHYGWPDLLDRLLHADIGQLRAALPEYEHDGVLAALQVSVEALGDQERECFLDLAVFPEDLDIPEAPILRLWSGRLPRPAMARDTLQRLVDLSLLRRDESRQYRLHDLYFDYLAHVASPKAPRHRRLVEAYRCASGWPAIASDGYILRRLTRHLRKAGLEAEARSLLLDLRWLTRQARGQRINVLLADLAHLRGDAAADALARALRLSSHILARAPEQLPAQLRGRLALRPHPDLEPLVAQATALASPDVLCPRHGAHLASPGPLIATLEGHTDWVNAVAVLPDGRRAISGSDDNTLRLWDLEAGTTIATLEGHSSRVTAVAVLPDGRRAISGSWDNTLRLWDLEAGTTIATLEGHSDEVTAVAVLPDGRRAISGSWDNTLRLWDLEAGTTIATLEGHTDWVTAVAVLPDGRRAISGSDDNTLRLWDLEAGTTIATLEGHSSQVTAVAVLPDGRRAISGSYDNTLRLWDLEARTTIATLEGHSSQVTAVAVLPDGRRAISGSSDNTLRLWDLEAGTTIATLEGHSSRVTAVAVLPDGRRAISGSWDNTLRLWDLEAGTTIATLEGHTDWVTAVAVLPDGRRAISGSWDNTLRLWDLEAGTTIATLEGHTDWVTAVAVLPDGRRAISGSDDNTLRLWDLEAGTTIATLEGHSSQVTAVAVLPDGRRAISGSYDNTLRLWDLEARTTIATLEGHSSRVTAVAVLPDGRRAISGSWDNTLRLWDLEAGTTIATLEGHSDEVTAVAVLPDGRRAISGSDDNTLRLWDLEARTTIATLEGHSSQVTAVAVLPDGRRAVSGSEDNSLRLWDLEAGTTIATFIGDDPVTAVAVSPDGRIAVAGDSRGRVMVFDLPPP